MKDKKLLIILVVTAVTAGCLHANNTAQADTNATDSSDPTRDRMAECGDVQINIDQASSTAMIRQMNQKPIGETNLTWQFTDGETVEKTINLTTRGSLRFIQSGRMGEIESLEVRSLRCPDAVFRSN